MTVWWPSPPVHDVNARHAGTDRYHVVAHRAHHSRPVSPLAFNSTRNAAAWHGSAPSIMASTPAHQASSLVRLFCSSSACRAAPSSQLAWSKEARARVATGRGRALQGGEADAQPEDGDHTLLPWDLGELYLPTRQPTFRPAALFLALSPHERACLLGAMPRSHANFRCCCLRTECARGNGPLGPTRGGRV